MPITRAVEVAPSTPASTMSGSLQSVQPARGRDPHGVGAPFARRERPRDRDADRIRALDDARA